MKKWREAATLILAVRTGSTALRREVKNSIKNTADTLSQAENYRVLLLKRSSSNKFMPSRLVFPGGVTQTVDHSSDWCSVYKQVYGVRYREVLGGFGGLEKVRPPMVDGVREGWGVTPDVAFRICAIRETFEESGLLLCVGKTGTEKHTVDHPWAWEEVSADHATTETWRQRVQEDPAQFLHMCMELNVAPNVLILKQWRNWLTPAIEERLGVGRESQGKKTSIDGAAGASNPKSHDKNSKLSDKQTSAEGEKGGNKVNSVQRKPHRFDTMFYMCCMDANSLPNTFADNTETLTTEWHTPTELIDLAIENVHGSDPRRESSPRPHLAPPQIYELMTMQRYSNLDDLCSYSERRNAEGMVRWMPEFRDGVEEGFIILLPGDFMYPETVDYEGTSRPSGQEFILPSIAPLSDHDRTTQPINRIIFPQRDFRNGSVLCNIT